MCMVACPKLAHRISTLRLGRRCLRPPSALIIFASTLFERYDANSGFTLRKSLITADAVSGGSVRGKASRRRPLLLVHSTSHWLVAMFQNVPGPNADTDAREAHSVDTVAIWHVVNALS